MTKKEDTSTSSDPEVAKLIDYQPPGKAPPSGAKLIRELEDSARTGRDGVN